MASVTTVSKSSMASVGPSVEHRAGLRVRWEIILLSLPALLVVLLLFIFPFLFGFDLSLHTGSRGDSPRTFTDYQQYFRAPIDIENFRTTFAKPARTLANYQSFFGDKSQIDTIGMTFQVAFPVTLFNVMVSIPLAYYMRRGIRFERFITILLILPITLGTVMVSQAMLMYFGQQGWFNQALQGIGLIRQPLRLVHNWIGVEIALFIQGFPFVFLMILGYMSGISPDLERASSMLGANAWQTFRKVIWPLSLPGVTIAFALNFVANFSVFPSAQLVGEPNALTRVLSIVAYRAAFEGTPNPPLGTAIALIMGAIELIVIMIILGLRSGFTHSATLGGGKGA